jgi:phage baseplate assembly protein gpV
MWNGSLDITSAHAGIRIGSLVEMPGGRIAAVESIHHSFDVVQGGNYQSRCRAVPKERWGIQRRPVSPALLGPFQAVVMENDDPERLGRVRVALSEDPERRVTPWQPVITVSGGNETGLFWVPEKDNLVQVIAPSACPEAMLVLGGLRGDRHRVPAEWRSSKNARKAFAFRNGVRIVVDDDQQTLRFETQGGSWQLDGHGLVKVKARQYDAYFDETAKLEARTRVAIDADRIDLG